MARADLFVQTKNGVCQANGSRVLIDLNEAARYFKFAADFGIVSGQYN
jgi:TPR repeat protein